MKKGFQIWYDKEMELYCAEKDGWDFMADTPCSLLGIIAIYEFKNPKLYSEYWWKEEKIDFRKNLSKERPEYISVIKREK